MLLRNFINTVMRNFRNFISTVNYHDNIGSLETNLTIYAEI